MILTVSYICGIIYMVEVSSMQKKRKYSITFNEKKFTTKTGIVVNPIMLKDSV